MTPEHLPGCAPCANCEDEVVRLREERNRLAALVTEAYPGEALTNAWRKKAETLGAWPRAGVSE